jgi:hypothetical protein
MMVMPSNNSGIQVGYLAGKFQSRIGWLISPESKWAIPPKWMPYAIDNGAYGAFLRKEPWKPEPFFYLMRRAKEVHKPLWIVVPDVVGDAEATIIQWHEFSGQVREYSPNVPLAFAVQDGMTPYHVPTGVDVIFVGGSTEWKWRNLRLWTDNFPRVHVGRVNGERLLWAAHDAGAESCDGTGWMRRGEKRIGELTRYLEETDGENKRRQLQLL